MINVIASGSAGNAVLYNDVFLVDCGVTYKTLKDYDIIACYITHRHGDHYKVSTIKKLIANGTKIYIHKTNRKFFYQLTNKEFTKEFIKEHINFVGEQFDFSISGEHYKIMLDEVPHDVKNFAMHISISNPFDTVNIFHVTDAGSIAHLKAPNYNYYSLETNYNDEKIKILIKKAEEDNKYNRYTRSLKTHLSKQQAIKFLNKNKGDKFVKFTRLHQSNKTL